MKNKIIYILLCSVFLLVSCSKQEEPPSIDYEKISSELTELLNTTEPYMYTEWKYAEVSLTEDSFEILYPLPFFLIFIDYYTITMYSFHQLFS